VSPCRAAGGGGGGATGTAACGAWALSGARTRAITRALVAAEVAPPLPTQQQQPQQQQEDGEGETETGMEVVVGGPRGPPPTGTGATNQVALRLLRWVAAASAYWRPVEKASVHQIGDYCDADEGEGEGQSGRAEAAAAAAAVAAARAAMEAATLRDVLAVLNVAPRADEDPVGRDSNLMEAGFDSLQVVDLLRQLQAAAPAGTAALTASALMEHPTAAGLVAHMMQTWQPRPAGTAAAAAATATSPPRGGGGKKRRTRGRGTPPTSSAAAAGTLVRGGGSGGGRALRTSIHDVLVLLLLAMCGLLGAAVIRQGRRVRAGQALLRAMEERGPPTCGNPAVPVEVEVDAGAGRGRRRRFMENEL